MIQINDSDLPIVVAEKIITGTKIVKLNSKQKAIMSLISSDSSDECEADMFDLDDIKEIIDYLTVFYDTHKEVQDADDQ